MLFNSLEFILVFLPVALGLGAFAIYRESVSQFVFSLTLVSLAFYSYWNPVFLPIILFSVGANYLIGGRIVASSGAMKKLLLTAGIVLNLSILGWFKYKGFFASVLSSDIESSFSQTIANTALPIGISFYTFQQIAYLVDVHSKDARYNLTNYMFFVTFFPQLIAGPIVHHSELIPQLESILRRWKRERYLREFLGPGIAIFSIGLAKKCLLADQFGQLADIAFDAAARGDELNFLEAWGGALAYCFQIYFDFSAYSDMAIGLGLFFGFRLPINFAAPYRAASIIEFWRRWHMTLSRFLRDYVYIPLGGNRKGVSRRYVNMLTTMVLGGLWHGAAWTFILWGALHGLFLAVNHLWRDMTGLRIPAPIAVPMTFVAATFAWVPFRAVNLDAVLNFWAAMTGQNGVYIPSAYQPSLQALEGWLNMIGVEFGGVSHFLGVKQLAWLVMGMAIVWAAPVSHRVLDGDVFARISQSRVVPFAIGGLLTFSLVALLVRQESTFLYFQF
jgi:alginate O-acetyltransferase complex protein AlgI